MVYMLTSDSHLVGINLADPTDYYEAELFPAESDDQVVGLQYLADNDSVCVALRSGDILLYTKATASLECVGNMDTGVLEMSWSPDFELVILVTGAGTLLQMTKDFEMLNEVPIEVDTNGEAIPISVGWGKKETQFHGSAGKYANQKKEVINPCLSEDDDQRPRISWRGDGQFFVSSSVNEQGDKRVLRIYNRECILQSTSEEVPKLEHPLSWRPSGNLITSTQRHPQKHEVVFFEKNGLRHGEFTIREEAKVEEVAWNSDSSILALVLEKPTGSFVQLWTMNNYYYYLKQEIPFAKGAELTSLLWDPEKPLSLHVTLQDGHYLNFEFCWDIFSSSSLVAINTATVAVVDGTNLLLTPFKFMNVPPPMAAFSLKLPSPASYVSFSPSLERTNDFVVLCANSTALFFGGSNKAMAPTLLASIKLPAPKKSGHLQRQLCWVSPTTLLYLEGGDEENRNCDSVVRITMSESPSKGAGAITIASHDEISCNHQIMRITFNVNDTVVALQAVGGELFVVDFAQSTLGLNPWVVYKPAAELPATSTLPAPCQWMSTVNVRPKKAASDSAAPEDKDFEAEDENQDDSFPSVAVVSLNNRGKLFVNGRLLASNCSSYHLHSDFLIFSTFSHLTRFVLLSELLVAKINETVGDTFDESVRPVERGSSIVVSIPHDVSLVLQMPRGNLESVCPRALVLSTVRDALDALDFKKALLLARKHRIDMNILHDHNPESFVKNLKLFLSQIDDPEHLNLFLSGLKNENVNETMYRGVTATRAISTPVQKEVFVSKVNRICQELRVLMMGQDADRYMKSILTAYVCVNPPDLESALLLIKKAQSDAKKLDSMLKYATFLVDVNLLFNVALGLYDFELVLAVAQRSQKDPKEYLPFLSDLQKLEPNYRKFKIDSHLKRHKKALVHLAAAGEERFEEVLQYTISHALYPEAVDAFSGNQQKTKRVMKAYGEYLESQDKHEEAGFAFSCCGEERSALLAYQKACAWRQVFTMAGILGLKDAELVQLGREVAAALKERSNYQDASFVIMAYVKDPEEAITALITGLLWEEALRVSHSSQRPDLVETTIKPGALAAFTTISEEIQSLIEKFQREQARLEVVRGDKNQRFEQMNQLGLSAGQSFANDNVDMFSDTSSLASAVSRSQRSSSTTSSRMSKMSSKNKRKMERKKLSSKEGGLFEEAYLLESLTKVISRANKLNGEVRTLLTMLLYFGHRDKGKELQALYSRFLAAISSSMGTIYQPKEVQLEKQAQLLKQNPDAVLDPLYDPPEFVTAEWRHALLA